MRNDESFLWTNRFMFDKLVSGQFLTDLDISAIEIELERI